jgi:hypothetical protein
MMRLQLEAGANTALQKSVRKLCRQALQRAEACAVRGNNDLRSTSSQGIAGLSKERFKGWPSEMESTKNSVDGGDPGQLLRIAHDIHNACMTASGHHHQSLILYLNDHSLIMKNKRIGRPGPATKGLLSWHAMRKHGRPIDFPGHQQRIVE